MHAINYIPWDGSEDIDEADAHHEHDDDNGDNDAAHDNRSFTIIIRQSYTTRLVSFFYRQQYDNMYA